MDKKPLLLMYLLILKEKNSASLIFSLRSGKPYSSVEQLNIWRLFMWKIVKVAFVICMAACATWMFAACGGDRQVQANLTSQSNWHGIDLPANSVHLFGVEFGINNFVTVGEGYDFIQDSKDGTTWSVRTDEFTLGHLNDIAYGVDKFVAVGAYDSIAISNDNGLNWQSHLSGSLEHFRTITFGNGIFVAGGLKNLGETGVILTSPDGVTWSTRYTGAFTTIFKIAYGNATFVAIGTDTSGGVILTTNDNGLTWVTRKSGLGNSLSGISFGDGMFIAVGGSGTILISSDNGITWQNRTSGITDLISNIAFGNGVFAAVSSNFKDHILVSNDNGLTWKILSYETNYLLNDICFGGNMFVAVGDYGIYRSDTF